MGEALKDEPGQAYEPAQQTGESQGVSKLTGEAADTLIAETAQCVRHYPLSAVAAAFGGGVLVGWLIAYNLKGRISWGREERRRSFTEDKANSIAISIWENEGGANPS